MPVTGKRCGLVGTPRRHGGVGVSLPGDPLSQPDCVVCMRQRSGVMHNFPDVGSEPPTPESCMPARRWLLRTLLVLAVGLLAAPGVALAQAPPGIPRSVAVTPGDASA